MAIQRHDKEARKPDLLPRGPALPIRTMNRVLRPHAAWHARSDTGNVAASQSFYYLPREGRPRVRAYPRSSDCRSAGMAQAPDGVDASRASLARVLIVRNHS